MTPRLRLGRHMYCFIFPTGVCLSVTKSCPLYNLKMQQASSETLYKYQSILSYVTLVFILFEVFPLELCLSQNRVRSVP